LINNLSNFSRSGKAVVSDPRDERSFGKDRDQAADRRLGSVEWEPLFVDRWGVLELRKKGRCAEIRACTVSYDHLDVSKRVSRCPITTGVEAE